LSGEDAYSEEIDVSQFPADPDNAALRYLWARHKVQLLDDYGEVRSADWNNEQNYQDSIKEEITALGLKYNLLTQYTSFIAVDSLIRADSGQAVTVKQPLPMPEGVSDNAIGDRGSVGAGGFGGQGGMPVVGEYAYFAKTGGTVDPGSSVISSVFPNPFSQGCTLRLYIHADDIQSNKILKLYNSLGQLIDEIELSAIWEGWQIVELDFSGKYQGFQSGVYTAVLYIGDRQTEPVRMLYIK